MDIKDCTYDVVISFTRKETNVAVALSLALENIGLKAYFYPYVQEENIGLDLQQNLSKVYEYDGVVAVGIFTEEYFDKKYTLIEFEAIIKRLKQQDDYLIPVLLNNQFKPSQISGLTYHIWNSDPKQLADIVFKRIQKILTKSMLLNSEEISKKNLESLYSHIERLQKFKNFENAELQYQLGLCYYFLNQSVNDLQLSEQYFRKAMLLKPRFHEAFFWLSKSIISQKGLLKIKHKELKEAIDFLKKAIALNPNSKTYKNFALRIEKEYFQKFGLRSPF